MRLDLVLRGVIVVGKAIGVNLWIPICRSYWIILRCSTFGHYRILSNQITFYYCSWALTRPRLPGSGQIRIRLFSLFRSDQSIQ